jgi:hypothetical protein
VSNGSRFVLGFVALELGGIIMHHHAEHPDSVEGLWDQISLVSDVLALLILVIVGSWLSFSAIWRWVQRD